MLSRRALTKGLAAVSLFQLGESRAWAAAPDYDGDCGVTSGSPLPGGFIIWTRIPPEGRSEGGAIEVRYEVATAPDFSAATRVATGRVTTSSARDFTVKVRISGLSPNGSYHYRFTTESGYASAVGRARTAPSAAASVAELRLAAVSCQSFSAGFYSAYFALAQQRVDFVVHLGDHIYERDAGRAGSPDPLSGRAAHTLADYRKKYRYYLSDASYREARRLFTWIDLWDDHEVFNDYAAGDLDTSMARCTGAYGAFAEYMPIDEELARAPDGRPILQMFRRIGLGSLVDLFVLDQRQYRDGMPCDDDFMTQPCGAARASGHSMLGRPQKSWFKDQLAASDAKWKVLLSEVMVAPFFVPAPAARRARLGHLAPASHAGEGRHVLNLDCWDGFPAERAELLEFIATEGIQNFVTVTGDIHSAYDCHLRRDPSDQGSPAVGVEFITAAISSWPLASSMIRAFGADAPNLLRRENPHMDWLDLASNGFTLLRFTEAGLTVEHVAVESTATAQSPHRIVRTARVASGHARISAG